MAAPSRAQRPRRRPKCRRAKYLEFDDSPCRCLQPFVDWGQCWVHVCCGSRNATSAWNQRGQSNLPTSVGSYGWAWPPSREMAAPASLTTSVKAWAVYPSNRALPVSKRTGGAGTTSAGNEFNGRFLGSWGKQRVKRMSRFVLARWAAGAGLATALVLLIPAGVVAAPALSSTAVVKSAAGTALVDVRWRRRGWRRSSYFIGSPYYGYGRYSNSGCHVEGGYYRPNGCW